MISLLYLSIPVGINPVEMNEALFGIELCQAHRARRLTPLVPFRYRHTTVPPETTLPTYCTRCVCDVATLTSTLMLISSSPPPPTGPAKSDRAISVAHAVNERCTYARVGWGNPGMGRIQIGSEPTRNPSYNKLIKK
jgi:hypothetical protein